MASNDSEPVANPLTAIEYLNTPLTIVLAGELSEKEIRKVIGYDINRATTPAQLWAMWFGTHCSDTEEFIDERYWEPGDIDERFRSAVLRVIDNVRAILT